MANFRTTKASKPSSKPSSSSSSSPAPNSKTPSKANSVTTALTDADSHQVSLAGFRNKQLKSRQKNLDSEKRRRVSLDTEEEPRIMAKGTCTIPTKDLSQLQEDSKKLAGAEKRVEKLTQKVTNRDDTIERMNKEKKEADGEYDDLVKQNKSDNKANEKEKRELQKKLDEAIKKLEEARKKSSGTAAEICQDIVNSTKDEVKYFMFQYKKFARVMKDGSSPDIEVWGGRIYDRLLKSFEDPKELTEELTKEDYCRIYQRVILTELSDCRQYAQSQLMMAAEPFYEKFNRSPTQQDMKDIRAMTQGVDASHFQGGDTEFTEEELEALWKLSWYHDVWLNKASIYAKYGNTVRYYERANAKNEEKRPHVTLQTEAFAELVRENCENKWNAVFELRAGDDKRNKTPIPKFNKDKEETFPYHATKWTDPRTGAKKGGGWKGDWATVWKARVGDIKAFRKEVRADGEKFYVLGLKLVRIANKVTAATYKESRSRKKSGDDEPTVEEVIVEDCGDDCMDDEDEE